MLFSGRANPALARSIGDRLGVGLGPVTLKTFSNDEVYCRFEESIRGADVFLVQPMCGNPGTGVNANDALLELLVMVDAAVGASAHRVIAVTPWFGYSRQDKKSAPREPISARLVARMLESAGVDRVLTMDLHAGQLQGFFQVPVDHMTALMMLSQHFRDLELDGELDGARRGRTGRRPGQAQQAVRRPDGRRPRDPGQGAPAAADGVDRARDRRRRGGRPRSSSTTSSTPRARCAPRARPSPGQARRGSSPPPPTPCSAGAAYENLAALAVRADRRHRHHPAAARRPGQRAGGVLRRPAHRLDPHASSPTTPSARSSAARTTCSDAGSYSERVGSLPPSEPGSRSARSAAR